MEFPHHRYHGNRPMHVVQVLHILSHNHQLPVLEGVWPHQLHWLVREEHTRLRSTMARRLLHTSSFAVLLLMVGTRCVVDGVCVSMLHFPSVLSKLVALETLSSCV